MIAVGVDTHKERHHAVALDHLGQILAELVCTASAAGYRELQDWAEALAAMGELVSQSKGPAAGALASASTCNTRDTGCSRSSDRDAATGAPASQTASTRSRPPNASSPTRMSRYPEDAGFSPPSARW